MKLKPKHEALRRHLARWIDRARWPGYMVTDADLIAYIAHESTGEGGKPPPLAWVKVAEEITINQLWAEMADNWSSGFGWSHGLDHTIRCEWSERRGSNIWMRKLITIARGIQKKGFMEAMLAFTGFSEEDRQRYLTARFGPTS